MRIRLWTGLLALVLLLILSATALALQLSGWKQEVHNQIMHNQFAEAEKALQAHAGEAGEDIEFLYLRGKLYRIIGKLKEAKDDLEKAVKKNKNFAEAHSELALVYGWFGNFDTALQEAEQAVKLSAVAEHYYTRGRIHTAAGRMDEALADINKAISMEAGNAEFYVGRGVVYRLKGKLKEAKADFDKAIALDKEAFRAYLERSAVYVMLGDPVGARSDINQAIELAPTYFGGYLRRGYIHSEYGEFGEALEDFARAIKLAPQILEGYSSQSELLLNLGRFADAEKVIRDGLKQIHGPDDEAQLQVQLYRATAGQKKYDEALAAINRYIALRPEAWEGYNMRGQLYYAQKKYAEAMAEFDLALKKNPKRLEPKINKVYVLLDQKKFEDALKLLNQILQEDPENIIALQLRFNLYEAMGRAEDALRDLELIEKIRNKLIQQQEQGAAGGGAQ